MAIQKIICKTNEEWRRERAKSVGASAVGTILGVNRFQTAAQLAEKMRAELAGHFDYSQTMAMMRGHAYEDGVAKLYSMITGEQIIGNSASEYIVRRTDIPFLHASPDRMCWIDNDGPKYGPLSEINKRILECKTTRQTVNAEKLPLSWVLQLQVQMGITGYHDGVLVWDQLHKADGFDYCGIPYNQQLFNAIVQVCQYFWNHCVVKDERPLSLDEIKMYFPDICQCGIDIKPTCCMVKNRPSLPTYLYESYQMKKAERRLLKKGYTKIWRNQFMPPATTDIKPVAEETTDTTVGRDPLSWFGGLMEKIKKNS